MLALFVDERNEALHQALPEAGGAPHPRRADGEEAIEAGFAIDLDAVREDVGDGVWGRPHIARALIRAGYAATINEAFDRFLGEEHPWYVPYEKWNAAEVIAAVHAAGGVCSLAHAVWYRDDAVAGLATHGLDAVEVYHPDHGPEEERFGRLAREFSLAVTAGSDFHGAIEDRKAPGGIFGDAEMLETLRGRAQGGRETDLLLHRAEESTLPPRRAPPRRSESVALVWFDAARALVPGRSARPMTATAPLLLAWETPAPRTATPAAARRLFSQLGSRAWRRWRRCGRRVGPGALPRARSVA